MWAMNVGKKLGGRKCLTSLKKPFHFFHVLIFLPISTPTDINDHMTECRAKLFLSLEEYQT